MKRFLLAAILGLVAVHIAAHAGVPELLSFQGRLSDAAGNAVADGDYSVVFRVHGQETGGTALWEETQTVTVADGLCSVLLGGTTTLDLPFDAQYWLAIEVESDGEMAPRLKLACAPYALRAKAADTALDGVPSGHHVLSDTPTAPAGYTLTGSLSTVEAWQAKAAMPTDRKSLGALRADG